MVVKKQHYLMIQLRIILNTEDKKQLMKKFLRAQIIICDEFINNLPNKYETLIGENGVRLSGGEKQRLSIARAMMKKSSIILLDEATSSLDSETEVKNSRSIKILTKNKTTIVIAHRLSTILNSNNIYVIDSGKIIDHGKHDDLMINSKFIKTFMKNRYKNNYVFFVPNNFNIIIIISPIIILIRVFKNKEHRFRYKEKFGFSSKKRAKGKLIWFHGASVGEILSVIPLIKIYEKDKSISQILITSSTLSSSKILDQFKLKKTIHQFYPIDHSILQKNF